MKTVAVLACLVASAAAFSSPMMATRAVGKKAAPKKAAAAPTKSSPPESKGYPSFADAAAKISFSFSGGGNKAPPSTYKVPDFSDPRLQIERDPEFYAAAAKTRKTAFSRNNEYVFEDGLTALERSQRKTIPAFLTGSAKSQIDTTAIRDDIEVDTLIFGLDTDRFQLLFLTVFGLFTLVGCLSGNLNL
mmetsp:Transcript_6720/g.9685  ORF Transcript_6720/g.9685 Transcript_6720/m.9685 type:complete len:189 (+) Transcript_6720:89-655(+)|eukprot:CAMPEP_0184855778 /NCGR_PEP_ID=MMETSP0580-20130426/924_1 /TAXON_ID=1118495 /ORGANISM="Dactyliosolen fragilissimus" /LENGTH=188 /DNA_ID=CAMNT_0027350387 /DNA_START=83 /DNA_END=649 /DNA_ORIENTATION=-